MEVKKVDTEPVQTVLLLDISKNLKKLINILLQSNGGGEVGLVTHDDYISRNLNVNSDAAFTMIVASDLGRIAHYGYIVSDAGTINVKVNEREDIPLQMGDVFKWDIRENFDIKTLRITTTSATNLAFRLFLS